MTSAVMTVNIKKIKVLKNVHHLNTGKDKNDNEENNKYNRNYSKYLGRLCYA